MASDTLEGKRHRGIPRQAAHPHALSDFVEDTLVDFLSAQVAQLDAADPALGGFARTARDLVMAGGKRLRPTFAYWGWRGVAAAEPIERVLPALAALELMHTFALVHDDVMDESATRRGKPTAHRVFADRHIRGGGQGDPERFGSAAAILVGDLCLVWADQLLARTPMETTTLFAVRSLYDRMRIEAVAGQYLDVLGESEPAAWSLDRALLVARLKTASYTVQRPLQFGLALAGPGEPAVDEAYGKYGLAVGEAFQLRDDILGVFGDPAVTGKPAGDDLRSGKPTALLMLARRLATPAQLAELSLSPAHAELSAGPAFAESAPGPAYAESAPGPAFAGPASDPAGAVNPADGSGGLTPARVDRLTEIVAETGAPERIETMISDRVAEAVAVLADVPIDDQARTALIELAVHATHRPA